MREQSKRPKNERKPYSKPTATSVRKFRDKIIEPTSLLGLRAKLPERKKKEKKEPEPSEEVRYGFSPIYPRQAA